jgi:hypothetical protein
MAEALKRTYDVVALKVEVEDAGASDGRMDVTFTLQGKVEGQLRDLGRWPVPDAVHGLTELLSRGRSRDLGDPQLDPGLIADLRAALERFVEGRRPLWVHLVKPYGALRFVPWERVLGPALGVPILMLPDFIFPRPREAVASLDVALCASAPLGWEEHSVRQALLVTAQAILRGSQRRTRLQVFADAMLGPTLKAEWGSEIANGSILLHEPQDAAEFVQDDPGSRLLDSAGVLRSPWLLWMRRALRERAVDVVHFCCHGHLSRGRGAMLFAQSPLDRSDTYLAGPVGALELQTFLTQVGAWSSAFESLPDNHSEPGLRGLADETAQARPGPMLMHNLRRDPAGMALADAYRFVYAPAPGFPPLSDALFLYCQPYLSLDAVVAPAPAPAPRRTRGRGGSPQPTAPAAVPVPRSAPAALPEVIRNAMQGQQVAAAARASPVDALFKGTENAQPWVATTERFAENLQLRYQELARDELLPEDIARHHSGIVTDTLESLRAAVAELAQRRGGRS